MPSIQFNGLTGTYLHTWGTVLGLLGLLLFSGCSAPWDSTGGMVSGPRSVQVEPMINVSESTFSEGQTAYLTDDFASAARKMEAYAQRFPTTVKGIEARYWHGMSLLSMGRSIQARDEFLLVKGAAASTRNFQALALRAIAKTYLVEGDYTNAENAYRRLHLMYPKVSDHAETLHALAEIAEKSGRPVEAIRLRRELATNYPKSPFAKPPAPAAVTPAGVASTPPSHSIGSQAYVVQAGVFSSRRRAEQQMARLRQNGMEAVIIRRKQGAKAIYVIQAGSFSSRSGAEHRTAELKRKGFAALVKP